MLDPAPTKSESNQLSQLKRNRAIIKGQLTRFKNFLAQYEDAPHADIEQLRLRVQKAQNAWVEFDRIQTSIELLDEAEGGSERIQFEDFYFATLASANRLTNDASRLEANQTVLGGSGNLSSNVKLPTIHLPTFDGQYHQWFKFKDAFTALVHGSDRLSPVEKFLYLKSALSGCAAGVLESLEVSDKNYSVAWGLLAQRFENFRLVVNSHVGALFDLPKIVKESHHALHQLLDNYSKHLRALEALGEPTEHWDTLLIHILSQKLDPITHRGWETSIEPTKLPTLAQLTAYLTKQAQLLEVVAGEQPDAVALPNNLVNRSHQAQQKYANRGNLAQQTPHRETKGYRQSYTAVNQQCCSLCDENHSVNACMQFLGLPVASRIEHARDLQLCTNCLKPGHTPTQCRSGNCKNCNERHHTRLHLSNALPSNFSLNSKVATSNNHSNSNTSTDVLLPTAVVNVLDATGKVRTGRVLLDSGSQSNFMTTKFAESLKLPLKRLDIPITGINRSQSHVSHRTNCTIGSQTSSFTQALPFLVIPQVTQELPSQPIDLKSFKMPKTLTLADPNFHAPSQVDMLLGAQVFWQLMSVGQIRSGRSKPVLQKTRLGWVVSGPIASQRGLGAESCHVAVSHDIGVMLERFWMIDEFEENKFFTKTEQKTEDHFVANTSRDEAGRFTVALPFRENAPSLGESAQMALSRFKSLERRLKRNSSLYNEYRRFMSEYEQLGHMSLSASSPQDGEDHYFLPHHCVHREASSTTKLRVVFDASAKTTSSASLNDTLLVGPTIQRELYSILLNFRIHQFVITADICKMYRQVRVTPQDRKFQLIFWRFDDSQPISIYQLNTVTYGTASAPFLATRCLQQLGLDHKTSHPEVSRAILNDFYVDDLLTGTDSVASAKLLKCQISQILTAGGFELRKWLSNEPAILDGSDPQGSVNLNFDKTSIHKPLGLMWNAFSDNLTYNPEALNFIPCNETKRSALSKISRVFDPLGLIGPITVRGKLIIQKMWALKLGWDDPLPTRYQSSLVDYFAKLTSLSTLTIPRHALCTNPSRTELHGFCDASEAAYGGCIYLRATDQAGYHTVSLLCAKSRVAPLKKITLPRLELCGALLLMNLVKKVTNSLNLNLQARHFWCDSTIVLSWLAEEPKAWRTFVANRVSEIQQSSQPHEWHYINTKHNPADFISRGTDPQSLIASGLWWHGPPWLGDGTDSWPVNQAPSVADDLPDRRSIEVSVFLATTEPFLPFTLFSSFTKLSRVTAFCFRFKNNCLNPSNKRTGPLTVDEINSSVRSLLALVQAQGFPQDMQRLSQGRALSQSSKLINLNPFLDKENLIRVGGRLKNSSLPYRQKHPIVLPSKHALTELIIKDSHQLSQHAGVSTTLVHVRGRYWPLDGRAAVRRVLRGCVKCFKTNPIRISHLMGDLPESRVTPHRPFLISGVDYAGPILIKDGHTRTQKRVKAYICLFVCFATKAVHLELVVGLNSESFLNALARFTSRRGQCGRIYSDNATNFVGARNHLVEITQFLANPINQTAIMDFCSKRAMEWHFIPPRSPHFGGLWEAAIKSTKTLLLRIIGETVLNYEQLLTVLLQVEAVLNSRPLTPLSSDPSDLDALTPGHFLVGEALTAMPQRDVTHVPTNRLSNLQLLQHLFQHFWKRWTAEYVCTLQKRAKWTTAGRGIAVGDLVILVDELTPPLKWPLARIEEVHPGNDGVIRVATVRTTTGSFKRSTTKLCRLPID